MTPHAPQGTGDRRNMSPAFVQAVKAGLQAAKQPSDDKATAAAAKVLWTNATLVFRAAYQRFPSENRNPHQGGQDVDGVADTIRRMHEREAYAGH